METILLKLKNIEKRYKVTFIFTFIWGIFAHIHAMVNLITYQDGLWTDSVGITFSSGRWFLGLLGDRGLIGALFGTYNTPFLSGMFFIFWIALVNLMLVDMFHIKRYKLCIVLSGILVLFPATISLFGYAYTSSYYGFSIFLAVFAVWITAKCEKMEVGGNKRNINSLFPWNLSGLRWIYNNCFYFIAVTDGFGRQ